MCERWLPLPGDRFKIIERLTKQCFDLMKMPRLNCSCSIRTMHNNAINSLKKSYYYNILKNHTHLNKPAVVRYVDSTPSIENHLAVVRGLPTKKFLPKYVNEKSSTECRSKSRQTNRSSQQCQVLSQHWLEKIRKVLSS